MISMFYISAIGKDIGKPLPGPIGPSGETIGEYQKITSSHSLISIQSDTKLVT